ncbi:MAG: hypothetical protein J7L96_01085, partial [Bacteroidales bacterium]|nr:hypothetical protein [Bacteroidales bacterium]
MTLLIIIAVSRIARWSMNPLLMYADQMIEKDNNNWQFSKSLHWPLRAIREPAFQKELAHEMGQVDKIRQLIITKIIPSISSVATAISLLLILGTNQPRHLPVIALIALLETAGQSIRARYSYNFDHKSIDPARKYHYLKSQMFSPIMLREHRVCQSLSAVINETQRARSVLHHLKRQYYTRMQVISLLIKSGQGLCIYILVFSKLNLLHQPLPHVLNVASLGVIYGAFRLIKSGSQLGRLPAIVLELRLSRLAIKKFDEKYSDYPLDQLHSQQISYLKTIKNTEVTALTGPNGAGKSTLILAFAQELSLLPNCSPAGFLFQNFGLLQSSIENNIVLYNKTAIRYNEMDQALSISGFKDVMSKYGW